MLNEQGVEVTTGYVSAIKAIEGLKAIRKRRRRQLPKDGRPERRALKDELKERAILLVVMSGGGPNARQLIDVAVEIVSTVRRQVPRPDGDAGDRRADSARIGNRADDLKPLRRRPYRCCSFHL